MHAHPSDASQAPSPILILGSTSPYRRELLSRLRWPFEVASPEVNECTLLGKPGDHAGARQQLQAMRGRTVHFHTAVCVKRVASGFEQTQTSTVSVRFRMLSDEAIDTYLHLEQPYDCAGSAKCEGLGIVLLERIR